MGWLILWWICLVHWAQVPTSSQKGTQWWTLSTQFQSFVAKRTDTNIGKCYACQVRLFKYCCPIIELVNDSSCSWRSCCWNAEASKQLQITFHNITEIYIYVFNECSIFYAHLLNSSKTLSGQNYIEAAYDLSDLSTQVDVFKKGIFSPFNLILLKVNINLKFFSTNYLKTLEKEDAKTCIDKSNLKNMSFMLLYSFFMQLSFCWSIL